MTSPRVIGKYKGRDVIEATLQSAVARVAILNYGCVIRDWRVAADGREVPCVLGFDSFEPYPQHSKSFGIIAGRVANRIGQSRYTWKGETVHLTPNEGAHHLHGGPEGLGRQLWSMEMAGDRAVELRYTSPHGENGYPGKVDFRVVFTLDGSRLICEMAGRPDRETPINLAQHSYYNLNGRGDVLGHVLEINADLYTPVDAELIPTGEMLTVRGTHMDFRTPVLVGERDFDQVGIDLNLILDDTRNPEKPAASLWSEDTGLELQIITDQRGIQVFNAPKMRIAVPGHDGEMYGPFAGIALEPQNFPDALNKVDWPSIICAPDRPYAQRLVMDIAAQ